ncbi:TPA: hypothetical protein HA351_10160 [Methanosarcinaceae archaeon]|nr:hypothetical protein [Methanosarcinaceae archaeon]
MAAKVNLNINLFSTYSILLTFVVILIILVLIGIVINFFETGEVPSI